MIALGLALLVGAITLLIGVALWNPPPSPRRVHRDATAALRRVNRRVTKESPR